MLGIPRSASKADGRRAYLALARALHPDKGGDAIRFQAVQRAWDAMRFVWARDEEERRRATAEMSKRASGGGGRATVGVPEEGDGSPPTTHGGAVSGARDGIVAAVVSSAELRRLGDAALAAKDFSRAVDCYDAFLARARLEATIPSGGMRSQRNQNRLIVSSTEKASVHCSRGRAHAGLNRWAAALSDAEKSTALRGLWLPPRALRGRALEALGRWSDAVSSYASAMALVNTAEDRAARTQPAMTSGLVDDEETAAAVSIVEGLRRARRHVSDESCVATMVGHSGPVTTVAFAPAAAETNQSSHLVASASDDGTVRVWDAPGGACRLVLHAGSLDPSRRFVSDGSRGSGDGVTFLAWGSRPIASSGAEGDAGLCHTREAANDGAEKQEGSDGGDEDQTWCLAASTVSGALTLWHVRASCPSPSSFGSRDPSPAARVVIAAEHRLLHPGSDCTAFTFDQTARQLATGFVDGACVVWCTNTGEILRRLRRRHTGSVTSLAFHPTGWQMCSGSTDEDARVWDLEGMTGRDPGECMHTLRWHSGQITDVSYSVCSRLIITAAAAHLGNAGRGSYRLLVWSAVSGRLCKWYDAHLGPITALSWHSCHQSRAGDGADNLLVTGCEDGAVRLWSIQGAPAGAGTPLHECWDLVKNGDRDDEKHGGRRGMSHAWARRRGGIGGPPLARGAALCVAHSPGGGRLALAHADGSTRVIDSRTFAVTEEWCVDSLADSDPPSDAHVASDTYRACAVRSCAWAPRSMGAETETAESLDDQRGSDGASDDDEERCQARERERRSTSWLMLATGSDDGIVRLWRVDTGVDGDTGTWLDLEEDVTAAIGPGESSAAAAATAITLRGAASGHAFQKHLTQGQPHGSPMISSAEAAAAEARVSAWKREYEEAEAAVQALCLTRAAVVRENFPRMSARERREYNAAHAERMKPLREWRGRLYRLVKTGGAGEQTAEDDVERRAADAQEDVEEMPPCRFSRKPPQSGVEE